MKGAGNIILIFIFLSVVSCHENNRKFSRFSGFTQGTTYSVIYEELPGLSVDKMRERVEKVLYDFDMSLSAYNPESIISAINMNQDVQPDSLFLTVLNRAREVWEISGGVFDITAGPLINAWGFGPDAVKRFDESKLDSLMKLVGMDKISLVDGKVVKADPNMYLDVNAIAQGYSVDVVGTFLERLGINNYLVEVGGEVRTRGTKAEGQVWKIAVDKPRDGNFIPGSDIQTIISLSGNSLATSGNYRKFYEEEGIKYSHTIDPRSGYPVMHKLLSVTIVADDCMSADAIATACMVLGLEDSKNFLLSNPEFEGYLVYSNENGEFNTWFTEGMLRYISE
ncbi:MAG TPA: FAD:protein FMN transferase [Bacteroidales bacterium]|nr:FAD:protein FMN transferase [Bacteroidales bacterium]